MIFILQIIKQRIWRHTYQEGLVWNSDPGALLTLPEFSDSLSHFPFHFGEEQQQLKAPNAAATGCEKFTAVIYTTLTSASTSSKVASSQRAILSKSAAILSGDLKNLIMGFLSLLCLKESFVKL